MKEIPLSKYIEIHGQTGLAKLVGLTQGAVYQMTISERNIFVVETDNEAALFETKQIGKSFQLEN
jgi:hypothetical protein